MKYEIYKDSDGEWRWRFKAANGRTVAVSSEGYARRGNCEYSIELMKVSSNAPVREV